MYVMPFGFYNFLNGKQNLFCLIKITFVFFQSHCFGVAGRYRHEIVLYDNKILIFGGGNIDTLYSVNNVSHSIYKGSIAKTIF